MQHRLETEVAVAGWKPSWSAKRPTAVDVEFAPVEVGRRSPLVASAPMKPLLRSAFCQDAAPERRR